MIALNPMMPKGAMPLGGDVAPGNPFQDPLTQGTGPTPPVPASPAQGGGSVPNAPPSPGAAQATGTPAQVSPGVPSPQPQPAPGPSQGDLDSLLAEFEQAEPNPQTQPQGAQPSQDDLDGLLAQFEQGTSDDDVSTTSSGGQSTAASYGGGMWKAAAAIPSYPVRALNQLVGAANYGIGKIASLAGAPGIGKDFQEAGAKMLEDARDNSVIAPLEKGLKAAGLWPEDENSLSAKIGEQTVMGMAQVAAMVYAAPAMAANKGVSVGAMIVRGIGEAAQHNPWIGMMAEVMGGAPGTVIGAESTNNDPLATMVGGLAGGAGVQLATHPVQAILSASTRYGIKLTQKAATAVADTIDKVGKYFDPTGQGLLGGKTVTGKTPGPTIVSDDVLDAYRAAEAKARASGDAVVQAAKTVRGMHPDNPDRPQAAQILREAQAAEQQAGVEADQAFNAIPEAVRGKYSQQSEAIRAEAADLFRPRIFADEQLEGDRQVINGRVESALSAVQPSDKNLSPAEWSARIANGVQGAEELTRDMEGKLWGRVNLKQRFSEREPVLQSLDGFQKMVTDGGFQPDDVPSDRLGALYKLFAPKGDNGKFQKLPTLQQVRGVVSALRQDRVAELATDAPSDTKIKLLTNLEMRMHNSIADAFPDNVPLTQAKAFSSFYHDIFSRSDILPLLKSTKQGATKVRPEDVLQTILKRPHMMDDIYSMTDKLLEHPALSPVVRTWFEKAPEQVKWIYNRLGEPVEYGPGTRPQPDVMKGKLLSPGYPPTSDFAGYGNTGKLFGQADQDRLLQLRSDIEDGFKSQFQQTVSENLENKLTKDANGNMSPEDPTKAMNRVQTIVKQWTPKIQAFARVAGETQAAMDSAMQGIQARRSLEQSSMVRYFEGTDPEKAISSVWSSKDPAQMARNLISGEAGVGGFAKDPIALEGFRSGLVDHLFKLAGNDPGKIAQMLKDGRISRLMDAALGADRMDRLGRLTDRLIEMKAAAHSPWAEAIITGSRLIGLKISAMIPKVGEGAELAQAAIFSKTAKNIAMGMLAKKDPVQILSEAVRDPNMERTLLAKAPTDELKAMRQGFMNWKRVMRFNDALMQTYQASYGASDPQPVDDRPAISEWRNRPDLNLLGSLNPISSANAAEAPKPPSPSLPIKPPPSVKSWLNTDAPMGLKEHLESTGQVPVLKPGKNPFQ